MKKFLIFMIVIGLCGCYRVVITPDEVALAIKKCANNDGYKWIYPTETSGADGRITCNNGAEFKFTSEDLKQ